MEELLEVIRREMKSASWYYDERSGANIKIEADAQQLMYDRVRNLHAQIRAGQDRIRAEFFIVGAYLSEIERDGLYHAVRQTASGTVDDGYSNFYKFCKDVFGFKKRTAANLVMVYRKFCNEQGLLQVEYLNFSYTQLVELASMDDYRNRIPSTCSTRDIKKLKKLYKTYKPQDGSSYLDDLAEAERRHKAELAEHNAEKNRIQFIPARAEEKVTEKAPAPAPNIAGDEDEPEAVTPEREEKKPNTDAVIRGLLAQLNLLKNSTCGVLWSDAADIFAKALGEGAPAMIHSGKEVSALKNKIADLENEVAELEDDNEVLREANEDLRTRMGPEGASACTFSTETGEILSGKLDLKNKKAREEKLQHIFDGAKPWREIPELDLKIYRYDFINGTALLRVHGVTYWDTWSMQPGREDRITQYFIMDETRPKFDMTAHKSSNQVVDWLTRHAKEI